MFCFICKPKRGCAAKQKHIPKYNCTYGLILRMYTSNQADRASGYNSRHKNAFRNYLGAGTGTVRYHYR